MAEVKNSKIGNFRGKLGNLSARIIYGKTILARRPISYRVSYAPELVENRRKFTVSVKFAQKLITLSALYEIWLEFKEPGMSVYNYIIKKNYTVSSPEKPTVNNILIPPNGFHLPVTQITIAVNSVIVQIAPLDSVMTASAYEEVFVLNGLLCRYNPLDPKADPYVITTFEQAPAALDINNAIVLDISPDAVQRRAAGKYRNSILYLALVTLDSGGKAVQYSETFAREI